MAITRREFLKYTAVAGAALYMGIFDLDPVKAYAQANPPLWSAEALSIGVYCSGGCGMIVGKGTLPGYTGEYITYVQGNPDSIINGGRICSKCASSAQISTIIDPTTRERIPNPKRITQPMYRATGASDWTAISWTDAISQIATKTQAARNAGWEATDPVTGVTCNRTKGIAALGGSSLNNEAAYMMSKLYRALGLVYVETQARN
jgi:formate dehydrogenase major subunit